MIDDDLVLVDNIGTSLDTDPMSDFVSATYPFKLTFALTMFCLRGFMRVRLNLKEYTLAENDVLVVLPGSIGECLESVPMWSWLSSACPTIGWWEGRKRP